MVITLKRLLLVSSVIYVCAMAMSFTSLDLEDSDGTSSAVELITILEVEQSELIKTDGKVMTKNSLETENVVCIK